MNEETDKALLARQTRERDQLKKSLEDSRPQRAVERAMAILERSDAAHPLDEEVSRQLQTLAAWDKQWEADLAESQKSDLQRLQAGRADATHLVGSPTPANSPSQEERVAAKLAELQAQEVERERQRQLRRGQRPGPGAT
jgi:hypothetical protein